MKPEPFSRAVRRDLAEERADQAQLEMEAEVDRDMPELDGEERYREVMRRLREKYGE